MNFTTEQVEFLKEVYNIDVSEKMYKIKDGYVCECSSFYWLSDGGPEKVNKQNFEQHLRNIICLPEFYQIQYPEFEVVYTTKEKSSEIVRKDCC